MSVRQHKPPPRRAKINPAGTRADADKLEAQADAACYQRSVRLRRALGAGLDGGVRARDADRAVGELFGLWRAKSHPIPFHTE